MQALTTILFALLLSTAKAADPCPCSLLDSTVYPGTLKWDCQGLGLTSVPGQCYEIQALNVTELILTANSIAQIKNIDFAGMYDLKSLYFDTNVVDYFDPSALAGINQLEIFNGAHNLNMEIPSISLRQKPELRELILIGSKIGFLPNITASTKLETVDIRSCDLVTLPRPTFGTLEASGANFLLSMVGNIMVDVAADILLPIPSGSTINLDSYLLIWATDGAQAQEVRDKQWVINVDLDTNLKECGFDGTPTDATMC